MQSAPISILGILQAGMRGTYSEHTIHYGMLIAWMAGVARPCYVGWSCLSCEIVTLFFFFFPVFCPLFCCFDSRRNCCIPSPVCRRSKGEKKYHEREGESAGMNENEGVHKCQSKTGREKVKVKQRGNKNESILKKTSKLRWLKDQWNPDRRVQKRWQKMVQHGLWLFTTAEPLGAALSVSECISGQLAGCVKEAIKCVNSY